MKNKTINIKQNNSLANPLFAENEREASPTKRQSIDNKFTTIATTTKEINIYANVIATNELARAAYDVAQATNDTTCLTHDVARAANDATCLANDVAQATNDATCLANDIAQATNDATCLANDVARAANDVTCLANDVAQAVYDVAFVSKDNTNKIKILKYRYINAATAITYGKDFVFIKLLIVIFFLTSCSFRNVNYTKDDIKQGVWIENDKDSIIKITKYRKGQITGKRTYIYPDGSKIIYYYRNGKQLLKSTKIDKNGNKKCWTHSPSF